MEKPLHPIYVAQQGSDLLLGCCNPTGPTAIEEQYARVSNTQGFCADANC